MLGTNVLPITFGVPFGINVVLPLNLPLPTKIVTEVLEPINIAKTFGAEPDVDEVDSHVRGVMQTALDRLRASAGSPSWAELGETACFLEVREFGTMISLMARAGLIAPLRPDRYVRMIQAVRREGPTQTVGFAAAAQRFPDRPGLVDESAC